MSRALITETYLEDIANAIRAKNGSSDTYTPPQMAAAIQAIPTGGITPTGTVQITQNGTHDVTQYANANVNVQPNLQSKTVTENGTVTPDQGYDGLSSVVVNVQGGGGGSVYCHSIFIDEGTSGIARTLVVTSDDTPFTYETLRAWLYANGFTGTSGKNTRYFATGENSSYSNAVNAIAASESVIRLYVANGGSDSRQGVVYDTVVAV